MNIHKNARLTLARRQEMVGDMVERQLTPPAAAAAHGVSAPTVRKWLDRYLSQGVACLRDASLDGRIGTAAHALIPFLHIGKDTRRRRRRR